MKLWQKHLHASVVVLIAVCLFQRYFCVINTCSRLFIFTQAVFCAMGFILLVLRGHAVTQSCQNGVSAVNLKIVWVFEQDAIKQKHIVITSARRNDSVKYWYTLSENMQSQSRKCSPVRGPTTPNVSTTPPPWAHESSAGRLPFESDSWLAWWHRCSRGSIARLPSSRSSAQGSRIALRTLRCSVSHRLVSTRGDHRKQRRRRFLFTL